MRLLQPMSQKSPIGSLRERLLGQRRYSTDMLRSLVARLNEPLLAAAPTEEQRDLMLTAFMVSIVSLPMAFFPVCGLPVASIGLLLGLYGRSHTSLSRLSTWTIIFSFVGLLLSFMSMLYLLSIFFSTYFWS